MGEWNGVIRISTVPRVSGVELRLHIENLELDWWDDAGILIKYGYGASCMLSMDLLNIISAVNIPMGFLYNTLKDVASEELF